MLGYTIISTSVVLHLFINNILATTASNIKCLSPHLNVKMLLPPLQCKNVSPLGTNNLFVPWGQTFLTHRKGGGANISTSWGDKHFMLEAVATMMMLFKEMDVTETNILVTEERKLSAGAGP